jgi:uncharacterized membrane protein YbhN (UPF0104 family)
VNKYFRIAISGVLIGWIAWYTDWARVRLAFADMRGELWLAAVAVMLVCQAVNARRWQVLARELRFERPMLRLLGYCFIGTYFNLLLPTSVGGDVMRAWYLDGGSGRKLASFAAVLLDRLNGLLVLIPTACLAVALSPQELPAWIAWIVWSMGAAMLMGLASLPVLASLKLLPESRRLQMRTMLDAMRAPRALVEATCWSIVVQVCSAVIVWLIALALHADVPLAYCFVFVPMVALLTMLPVSVNGMGVREGGVALFLAPLGIDQSTAVTLAFLWFTVSAFVGLLGGGVYLCSGPPSTGRSDPDSGRMSEGQRNQAA